MMSVLFRISPQYLRYIDLIEYHFYLISASQSVAFCVSYSNKKSQLLCNVSVLQYCIFILLSLALYCTIFR